MQGRILWVLGALASLLAACSFVFVKAPPEPRPRVLGQYSCTQSNVAPNTDLGLAATLAVTTAVMVATELDSDPYGDEGPPGPPLELPLATVAIGGTLAGVFTASAVDGYTDVAECRDLLAPEPRMPIPQAVTETETETGTQSVAETGPESGSEPGTVSESEPGTEAESAAGTESGTETESAAGTETESTSEPVTGSVAD